MFAKVNLLSPDNEFYAPVQVAVTRNKEMMYKLIMCKVVYVHGTSRII